MSSYILTGIDTGTMSKDRSQFDVVFRTDKGPLTLGVKAEHLDALITCLQGLEYHASLLDPQRGAMPGEPTQIRAEMVDHHEIRNGEANGFPVVFLGLKSAQVFRWFALDSNKAAAVQQSLGVEIPKIRKSSGPN